MQQELKDVLLHTPQRTGMLYNEFRLQALEYRTPPRLKTPENSQQQSIFFRLPPEIRLIIYDMSLTSEQPITDPVEAVEDIFDECEWSYTHATGLGLGLFRTCQTIQREISIKTLIVHNNFHFSCPAELSIFLSTIPRQCRHLIKHIRLSVMQARSLRPYLAASSAEDDFRHYFCCPTQYPGNLHWTDRVVADVQHNFISNYHFTGDMQKLEGLQELVLDLNNLDRNDVVLFQSLGYALYRSGYAGRTSEDWEKNTVTILRA